MQRRAQGKGPEISPGSASLENPAGHRPNLHDLSARAR